MGLITPNIYIKVVGLIGAVSIFTAIAFGHGNSIVAIYGARILLIQFPFIFIIGSIFTKEDVIKMGKVVLFMSLPMTILIAIQFYSPQSALINRGLGGDIAGAGFQGALGYFRPPGTFSFTNGLHLFFGFAACFIFYFWFNRKAVNNYVLIAATIGLIAAIPFSISRSLFFHVAVTFLFTLIAISRKPKYIGKLIGAAFAVFLGFIILSKYSFFQTSTEAFFSRFESAGESEGGLEGTFGDRYFGGMLGALSRSSDQPFFGQGVGMGTNVGAQLLAGNREIFLISEEEWGRLIGELGPIMGLAIIFFRFRLTLNIGLKCYRKLLQGDLLPWLLLSFAVLTIPQAQWAQPTALGFSIMIGGLILASLKTEESKIINSGSKAFPKKSEVIV